MGFGRKYKDMPTPASIVFRVKVLAMICGAIIAAVNAISIIPPVGKEITSAVMGATITVAHGIENLYGTEVAGTSVKIKDVEVIKDEAIKMIIFLILTAAFIYSL